jgi:hypothetical protein
VTEQLASLEGSTGADGAALKVLLEKAVGEASVVEERGKPLPGFSFMSEAEANQVVALRRKQVRGFVDWWWWCVRACVGGALGCCSFGGDAGTAGWAVA